MTTEQAIEHYAVKSAIKAGYPPNHRLHDSHKYGIVKYIATAAMESAFDSVLKEVRRIRDETTSTLNVGPL